jgi:hypothetical protein
MKKTATQHVSISMAVAASPPAEPRASYPGINPNGSDGGLVVVLNDSPCRSGHEPSDDPLGGGRGSVD